MTRSNDQACFTTKEDEVQPDLQALAAWWAMIQLLETCNEEKDQ